MQFCNSWALCRNPVPYCTKCILRPETVFQAYLFNVCIAEVGGTDYVPVVSCLVQLVLDPHSRTLYGFENLVEREWVALRHQFVDRCALATSRDSEQVISLSTSD